MRLFDNSGNTIRLLQQDGKITVKKEDIRDNTEYIEIYFDEFEAEVGSDGYYVISDVEKTGSQLCFFTDKKECEYILKQNLMPFFGVKSEDKCVIVIAEGMKNEFYLHTGIKDNKYYIGARFVLDGDAPYEDISMVMMSLGKNSDYSDMARCYREYVLDKGECIALRDRAKENGYLQYAAESVEIRIRMGWKPAPPTVLEQTLENEPEMKVACDFRRVMDIIDELKRQGVDKAQLCLVGWNKSGHDGRYPQMFPVEEKLGGEEKLRELILYAQKNGYQIVCHTNSTDCYNIADCFSEDIVVKNKDGSLSVNENAWSGGRMYNLCPVKAYEIAKTELPGVRELGFKGIHYIDVMNVVPLRKCYDNNHKVNTKETEQLYKSIALMSKDLFGGFASEGAYDFSAPYLDYALYVTFDENKDSFFDEEIPLWQLVYHGIILSNPSTATVNYTVKAKKNRLKLNEYGGRPTFYFYSKFMEGGAIDDWLGREDMVCDTDEQLKVSVENIKKAYDEYKAVRNLQYEFMTRHTKIQPGIYEAEYSDGTVIRVNYNDNNLEVIQK